MKKQVNTTKDYHLFKPLDGNRVINELNRKRILRSMRDNYLFTVIIVNENYEIIDGQHRFECIKELGLTMNYIICENYGLREVQVLNANSKDWTLEDYMESYCDLGYPEYIKYKAFRDKYKISQSSAIVLLSGDGSGTTIEFKEGNYEIKRYVKACKVATLLNSSLEYYEGSKRRSYIYAILDIFGKSGFRPDEYLHKLSLQRHVMYDCGTVEQYKELIERIYNYRRSPKINLRF